MKLYGSVTSPFVRHCRIALIQGNLDWQFVAVDPAEITEKSPTDKVPFLVDAGRTYGDSCSIIRLARESAGQSFFPSLDDYDLFCLTNTVLDSAINLFLLEKEGLSPEQSPYLAKQARRIEAGLANLSERVGSGDYNLSDGLLRLSCFMDWGLYRNRIDIAPHSNLSALLDHARNDSVFASTSIPPGS